MTKQEKGELIDALNYLDYLAGREAEEEGEERRKLVKYYDLLFDFISGIDIDKCNKTGRISL